MEFSKQNGRKRCTNAFSATKQFFTKVFNWKILCFSLFVSWISVSLVMMNDWSTIKGNYKIEEWLLRGKTFETWKRVIKLIWNVLKIIRRLVRNARGTKDDFGLVNRITRIKIIVGSFSCVFMSSENFLNWQFREQTSNFH